MIKQYKKMINFDDVTKENIKEHNPNWPEIPDHSYRILIIRGSGSGKTNSLFNLIKEEPDIDENSLYARSIWSIRSIWSKIWIFN